jgi:hypothetical protein
VISGSWGYRVKYRPAGGSWIFDTTTTNSLTLTGLTSGTNYQWKAQGICDASGTNNSPWTSTQTFSTVNGCTQPININVTAITSSSATIDWDVVSAAFSYTVRYLVVGAPFSTKIDTVITTNTHNITGLIANENYRWRIKTNCNSSGSYNSGWTAWDTITTLSGNRIAAGDVELGVNLNIYPNPTRGIFKISFVSDEIDGFEITIIDAFGKMVSHEDKQDFIGEYTKIVDLSNWPRGVYMVQIKTQDSFTSKRIVLQ